MNMEDNVRNELIENGTLHSMLRSGTKRSVAEEHSIVTHSSKSNVRQRSIQRHEAVVYQSHLVTTSTTKTTECEGKKKSYFLSLFAGDAVKEKHHAVNGFPIHKRIRVESSRNLPNNVSESKLMRESQHVSESHVSESRHVSESKHASESEHSLDVCNSTWNTPKRSAYCFYKSTGDWWNVFPKTDYTYSKYSACRKEIAPGILPMPNMSRPPLHSSARSTSVNVVSLGQSRTYFGADKSHTVSSERHTVSRSRISRSRAVYITTVTTIWNFLSSLYLQLESLCYRSACYFLLTDCWLMSMFRTSSTSGQQVTSNSEQQIMERKHSKYLLFLLIPPLILAGLSQIPNSTTQMPNVTIETATEKTSFGHESNDMDLLVQKILASSEFKNVLLMQDFRLKEQQLQKENAAFSTIEQEQEKMRTKIHEEGLLLRSQIEQLELQIKSLQASRAHLSRRIGRCCNGIPPVIPKVEIERHIMSFLSGLFNSDHNDGVNMSGNGHLWIKTLLDAKDNLEERLANVTAHMNRSFEEATKRSADTIMASVSEMMRKEFLSQEAKLNAAGANYAFERKGDDPCDGCALSVEHVKEIVNNALNLYDADKTGMVDYALESSGGVVINIRCTENYNEKSLALAFLGMTFPWSSNHPRIALQPDVHPGNCWAFRGAQGYLVVRLAKRIKVTAFSIEHIPVNISPAGNIDAAPKNFSVWGLNSENDHEAVLLGRYMYENPGPSLQIFPVQNEDAGPYEIVELAIESNHGNLEYTCLYRFRVHGYVV